MFRADLGSCTDEELLDAGFSRQEYRSHDWAVYAFFCRLALKGEMIWWDGDERCFRIEETFKDRLTRLWDLKRRLRALLPSGRDEEVEDFIDRWLARFNVSHRSPLAIIREGGPSYKALLQRIKQIEAMARDTAGGHIVDDLCGLPLKDLRMTRIQQGIATQEALVAAEARDRVARGKTIASRAGVGLHDEADAWLSGPSPDGALTMKEWAALSDETLLRARQLLFEAAEIRETRLRQEREAAQREAQAQSDAARRQGELRIAANLAYPDIIRANLFLKNTHPSLGGSSPLDACVTEIGFRKAKACLPTR